MNSSEETEPRKSTPTSRIARNFLSVSAASLVERILNLFIGVYARHVLGVAVIGELAWTSSVVLYASLVVNPGLETIARREVARDVKQASRYVFLLFVIQVLMAVSAFALIQVFGGVTGRGQQIQLLLLFNALGLLLLPFDLNWLLQAHERMAPVAFLNTALLVIQMGAMFAFIHGPQHLFFYVLLPYPFRLVVVGFTIWYSLRHGFLEWHGFNFKWADVRPLVQAAIPVGLAQATVLLYGNSDIIFLGFSHSSTVVGLYSTAYTMMLVPTFLHSALTNSYFSSLARSLSSPTEAKKLSQQFLRLMIWIGLPLSALGWAVGRYPLVALFGPNFAGSGLLFEWLSLNIAFMFFNVGYLVPLIAWEHQGLAFRCTFTGALINVALNCWLIPKFGAQGAVVSTILSEAAVFVAIIIVRRKVHPLPWPRFLLPPAALCLLVAIATRFATDFLMPWWCAAILGAGLCLATCALLERDWTRRVLEKLQSRSGTPAGT